MKTALVTGSNSGLGNALCETLRSAGFQVVATARDTSQLPPSNAHRLSLALDVNNPQQIDDVVHQAVQWAGKIDVLINNAGFGQMGPLLELTQQQLTHQLNTNLIAPLRLAQAVVPHMPRHSGAVIVNIGSISATVSTPFAGAYCASKAAIQRASDALRMELKPLGIHVMTVQAGAIASQFAHNAHQALPKQSGLYHSVAEQIQNRANASQANPTPAHQVAGRIVAQLGRRTPVNRLRTGYGAWTYPLMAWLPSKLTDAILCRRFGLHRKFNAD